MNLRDAKKEANLLFESGISPMFQSKSGVGKSDMIHRLFQDIKSRDAAKGIRWGYGEVFLATKNPTALMGVPFKGEKVFDYPDGTKRTITVTDPAVPTWMISDEGLPANAYDRFFLFFDEYGQGDPDTKKPTAEVFLKKRLEHWHLPHGSITVGATNKGSRYGVTKDFDFCINRRALLEIMGDAKVWVEDFADHPYNWMGKQWQMMGVTKAWALTNPGILNEDEPKEQGPWCTPRSLVAADRYIQAKMAMNGGKLPTDGLTIETLAGIIGMPATASLVAHLQFKLNLPSYDEVVADPDNTPVPSKADLHMLMAYELAGMTQAKDLAPVIKYVGRMPKDMSITYVTAVLRRDYKGLMNEPAMQQWIAKNAALVSVIASLSNQP